MIPRLSDSERWWMDRFGTVWINERLVGRRPLTIDEILAIDGAIEDFIRRNGPGRDAQDRVN